MKKIVHQFMLPQPPEVVWKYLTSPDLLSQWLMPNDIDPVVGHQFQLQAKPMPRFGFDGVVRCQILEVIPNEKLVFSWKGGVLDTIVTWTLSKSDNGTVLNLEHSGFKCIKNYLPYFFMNKGWIKIGDRLSKQLYEAVL